MRKSMLTMGSILVLFVLVSISYQPISAENPIELIKESKDILKCDCTCSRSTSLTCFTLEMIYYTLAFIYWFILHIEYIKSLMENIYDIAESLNCSWTNHPF
jgi:hypothetical protein